MAKMVGHIACSWLQMLLQWTYGCLCTLREDGLHSLLLFAVRWGLGSPTLVDHGLGGWKGSPAAALFSSFGESFFFQRKDIISCWLMYGLFNIVLQFFKKNMFKKTKLFKKHMFFSDSEIFNILESRLSQVLCAWWATRAAVAVGLEMVFFSVRQNRMFLDVSVRLLCFVLAKELFLGAYEQAGFSCLQMVKPFA